MVEVHTWRPGERQYVALFTTTNWQDKPSQKINLENAHCELVIETIDPNSSLNEDLLPPKVKITTTPRNPVRPQPISEQEAYFRRFGNVIDLVII